MSVQVLLIIIFLKQNLKKNGLVNSLLVDQGYKTLAHGPIWPAEPLYEVYQTALNQKLDLNVFK